MLIKKHPHKNWYVSIIELEDRGKKRYKVTRSMPDMSVAETKIFTDKEEAMRSFDEWLE